MKLYSIPANEEISNEALRIGKRAGFAIQTIVDAEQQLTLEEINEWRRVTQDCIRDLIAVRERAIKHIEAWNGPLTNGSAVVETEQASA